MNDLIIPRPHAKRAQWAPLRFYPLSGSSDTLTVAVFAIAEDGEVAIAVAPYEQPLDCLFGKHSDKPKSLLQHAVEMAQIQLKEVGNPRLQNITLPFSDFELGEAQVGSGASVQDIAEQWMARLSMLSHWSTVQERENEKSTSQSEKSTKIEYAVREAVQSKNPLLVNYFGSRFRPKSKKLPVKLGFENSLFVANFGRLGAPGSHQLSPQIERIRSKLWVLAEHRDECDTNRITPHEMVLLREAPQNHAPDIEARVSDACYDLEMEADRREIRLRPMSSVNEISNHIVNVASG